MEPEAQNAVLTFFNARRGALRGFPFWDASDHATNSARRGEVTEADGLVDLGAGDGTNRVFQLVTRYTDAGNTTERPIVLPKAGTVIAKVGAGSLLTAGAGFSVNTLTGQVTLDTAPGNGVQVWGGCQFYIPCEFTTQTDQRLTLQAVGGRLVNANNLTMREQLNRFPVVDLAHFGGATDWTAAGMTADVSFDLTYGTSQAWRNNSGGARRVMLPAKASLQLGTELRIKSDPTSGNGLVPRDSDTSTDIIASPAIAAGETGICILSLDASGNREWLAF